MCVCAETLVLRIGLDQEYGCVAAALWQASEKGERRQHMHSWLLSNNDLDVEGWGGGGGGVLGSKNPKTFATQTHLALPNL